MLTAATKPTAPRPFFGTAAKRVDQARGGRRGRHDIAADDDERHLHGEGDQAPEPVAERRGDRGRRGAVAERGERHDDDREADEDEGVGKPALGPW